MKTTNNNMNSVSREMAMMQVKQLAAKRNARKIIVTKEQLVEEGQQEVLQAIYEGKADLQTLMNVTERVIDMNKCQHPIKTMQLIYAAGSEVGAVTTTGQNVYMLDVNSDEGFEAFKKSLVMLKDNETHEAYKSLWIEGYNKLTFKFEDGHFYVYYIVTNEEMRMLEQRIKAMDKRRMTKEDAKALQADLPPFIRAWQESSIDVSKDKDKVFDYALKDFFNSVTTLSQLTKNTMNSIDFGLDAIRAAKRAGKIIPKFVYSNAEMEKEATPCLDLMGHATLTLQDTAVKSFNGETHKLLAMSNNNLVAPFIDACLINREFAYFVKSVFNACYASITEDVQITDDQFAKLRNVIYTAALEYGVDREDVIKVAISAAMTTVYKAKDGAIVIKDANVNRFRQYPVAYMFPDEYVNALTGVPVYDVINPKEAIFCMTRNIEDHEVIEFVNGVSTDGAIELYDMTFNGCLVEYEGELVSFRDIFSFEVTNALLVNENTFKADATKEELAKVKDGNKSACDHGEFLASVVENLQNASIAGKNANILVGNGHFLCQFQANYEATKGAVEVYDCISYKPNNGQQQLFVLFVR